MAGTGGSATSDGGIVSFEKEAIKGHSWLEMPVYFGVNRQFII